MVGFIRPWGSARRRFGLPVRKGTIAQAKFIGAVSDITQVACLRASYIGCGDLKKISGVNHIMRESYPAIHGLVASGLLDRAHFRATSNSQVAECAVMFVTPVGYDLLLSVTEEGRRISRAMLEWPADNDPYFEYL
jgi:hypothetical protein